MRRFAIIPFPESLERRNGYFFLDAHTVFVADACTSVAAAVLADAIRPSSGFIPQVSASVPESGNVILFSLDTTLEELGEEGYRLDVTPQRVTLAAPTQAGLFYAVQTLRQLLPPEIFSPDLVPNAVWRIPCVSIADRPRFAWRGLMLDTGHDYQHLSYIFRFIDLMALHKLNVLHWHISDLGTFPLEIRGYPKLQNEAHGGQRLRGEPKRLLKPGSYTQNEARAVVAYAAARQITVVPEIDMPGHSTPVLSAYPEFDCPVPYKQWAFDHWDYCLGNEQAIAFIKTVLTQIMAIFPSKFIHIGGDECSAEHWKRCPVCQARIAERGLQNEEGLRRDFWKRIERFLTAHGRRMIGWDEIYENGVEPSTAVMAWRSTLSLAVPAAVAGHDVVMAPSSHLYFDYPETQTPIEKVYAYDPISSELTAEQALRVLGAQAQLWTDNHPTEAELDRLTYPRACALAEGVWTTSERRDWQAFCKRLGVHGERLALFGICMPSSG